MIYIDFSTCEDRPLIAKILGNKVEVKIGQHYLDYEVVEEKISPVAYKEVCDLQKGLDPNYDKKDLSLPIGFNLTSALNIGAHIIGHNGQDTTECLHNDMQPNQDPQWNVCTNCGTPFPASVAGIAISFD